MRVYNPESRCSAEFYARVLEDWRITLLKLAAELLEVELGDVVYVTLYAEKRP